MTEEESQDTSCSSSVESLGEEKTEEQAEEQDLKKAKLYHARPFWERMFHSIRGFSVLYLLFIGFCAVLIGSKYAMVYAGKDLPFVLYTNETPPSKVEPALSQGMFVCGVGGLGFALLDCLIYYVSGYLMKKFDCLTLSMFYVNSESSLISATILDLSMWIFLIMQKHGYRLGEEHKITLDQIAVIGLFSLLLITAKNMFVSRVRMGFNHTTYISRIQRCLLEHQFIKTLKTVVRRIKAQKNGKKKRRWMFSHLVQEQSEEDTPEDTPQMNQPEETEKYFMPKAIDMSNSDTIGLKQKMIIVKEFGKIRSHTNYMGLSDKSFASSLEIHQDTQKQAEKIAQELSSDKKNFQIKHLKKYVVGSYIDTITKFLGLPETLVLTQKEIAVMIDRIKKERYAIKKSLIHMDKALIRVSRAVTFVIFLFSLISLGSILIDDSVITRAIGPFVGVGFIFQPSVKNAIDSVIFLFIVHPYDIGDRIRVEVENEELNMVVSELNVFSTVFYQWDGAKIYIPNSVLLQKSIVNVRRSGLMAENIVFQVSFDTPPEKIQHLKSEVGKFIKKHPKDFAPYFMFNYHELENTNKLHLKIYLQHATNWQNFEAYLQRKAKFVMFLKQAIAEQHIEYYLPIQRVQVLQNTINTDGLALPLSGEAPPTH
ncbi:mechanosensitive ion channel protein 4/5/6/7/8/9/10 [Nematocida sp. AWRm77]|nr:mechanosensitive ion channel protein 4/5/6/7/8/9/10 [Nematocida sp. AWRm77]